MLAVGPWLIERRYRRAAGACLLCYATGHLFFTNLYYVHDYYPYASAFFLLVAIGLVVAGLLRQPGFPGVAAVILALGVFAGELYAFRTSYYNFYRRPNPAEPVETEIIRAITPPEDVIAVFGFDWNPVWPYYSQRRAIVPPLAFFENFAALDASLKNLGPRRLAVMGLARANRDDSRFTGTLAGKLQFCAQPIARTELMDIYVRKDLSVAAVSALSKRHWNAEINLTPDPGVTILEELRDLTALDWLKTLPAIIPARPTGPGDLTPSTTSTWTMAAACSRRRRPRFISGLRPAAGRSPRSAACCPRPTRRRTIPPACSSRFLRKCRTAPVASCSSACSRRSPSRADRGDIAIDYTQELPFTGPLVFAHYAGPSGSINFAWGLLETYRHPVI